MKAFETTFSVIDSYKKNSGKTPTALYIPRDLYQDLITELVITTSPLVIYPNEVTISELRLLEIWIRPHPEDYFIIETNSWEF
jgi:hypothetical protein